MRLDFKIKSVDDYFDIYGKLVDEHLWKKKVSNKIDTLNHEYKVEYVHYKVLKKYNGDENLDAELCLGTVFLYLKHHSLRDVYLGHNRIDLHVLENDYKLLDNSWQEMIMLDCFSKALESEHNLDKELFIYSNKDLITNDFDFFHARSPKHCPWIVFKKDLLKQSASEIYKPLNISRNVGISID